MLYDLGPWPWQLRFWRDLAELLLPRLAHKHDWEDDGNPAKRICRTCGRREWLMHRRFPRVGEAAYEWQDMTPPDLSAWKDRGDA